MIRSKNRAPGRHIQSKPSGILNDIPLIGWDESNVCRSAVVVKVTRDLRIQHEVRRVRYPNLLAVICVCAREQITSDCQLSDKVRLGRLGYRHALSHARGGVQPGKYSSLEPGYDFVSEAVAEPSTKLS